MASVKFEVKRLQQEEAKDNIYDPKAEEEMKKRWEQLKNKKQAAKHQPD